MKINREEILEDFVCSFMARHLDFLEDKEMSFFEVGLAFDYFAIKIVDIAIIEVGLGERLDGTNIITLLISVIRNIYLDHTQFLGTTIPEIVVEKSGIIKESVPVIIWRTH